MSFPRTTYFLILSLALLSPHADAQFETHASTPMGLLTKSIAVGDFNHDGNLDFAVVGSPGNVPEIKVALGKGDGTFETAVTYAIQDYPSFVATADLNGDGNLDLVAANSGSNSVSVLLGNGDGTFRPAMNFATPPDPEFVGIADFNEDGKLDLVTANRVNNSGQCSCIAILLGNGDGTFRIPAIITQLPLSPVALGIGRFDSDHRLDLVVTEEFETAQIQVLKGKGDGTFELGNIYSVGPDPSSVAVGDYNRDGKPDVAISEGGGIGIRVFLGNGDGSFQEKGDFPAQALWVTTADVNGDGILDLIAANLTFRSGVDVLLGNGDGSFGAPTYYANGDTSRFVAMGDFNGDHKVDILATDELGFNVITLLNTGSVTFSPNGPVSLGDQLIGTTGAPVFVSVVNTGATAVTISSINATKPFGVTTNCIPSIAPGTNCSLNVTFSPTTLGQTYGSISIRDNASRKPQTIRLVAHGTDVGLLPSPIQFAPQALGTKSPPQMLSVTNHSGSDLIIFFIQVGGVNPKSFLLSDTSNCTSQTLPAGATCQVAVTFSPTKSGSLTAKINVSDSSGGSPESTAVMGTGK